MVPNGIWRVCCISRPHMPFHASGWLFLVFSVLFKLPAPYLCSIFRVSSYHFLLSEHSPSLSLIFLWACLLDIFLWTLPSLCCPRLNAHLLALLSTWPRSAPQCYFPPLCHPPLKEGGMYAVPRVPAHSEHCLYSLLIAFFSLSTGSFPTNMVSFLSTQNKIKPLNSMSPTSYC